MSGPLELTIPGDKSLTHRTLLFGALASGRNRVRKPLVSADTRSTAAVLRQLGVDIPQLDAQNLDSRALEFSGVGLRGLRPSDSVLDCGNSGTTARLLLGVLAGQPMEATVTGDASLRSRPMGRVTDLLSTMGASFSWQADPGLLPTRIQGGDLRPIDIATGVASAQVKSAVLLAGLTSGVFALVTEPRKSRDHTEKLLAAMGAATVSHQGLEGWRVELRDPPESIAPLDFEVPGDFSTAAFPLLWAVLRRDGPPLRLRNVGLNPTRTGFLGVLRRMGARIELLDERDNSGEAMGTLLAFPSELVATEVGAREIPSLVDEVPAIVVAGLFAEGETQITGAGELRVKESDRIDALVRNLRALGVEVEEAEDGLSVRGRQKPPRGTVTTFGDHRIEMAFGVLEAVAPGDVTVHSRGAAGVSYPAFWSDLERLAASSRSDRAAADRGSPRPPVVTIDGPAGSGKSTTAKAVAAELGFVHLDSGALYRAVARALLDDGTPEQTWDALSVDDFRSLGIGVSLDNGRIVLSRNGRSVADADLRTAEVTGSVSRVAALPAVREALIELQREAGRGGGLVVDGRDTGTVVFPDAEVKIFLIADLEERARRRLLEDPQREADTLDDDAVTAMAHRLQARDFEDSHREHAPLRRPENAKIIDTTRLSQVDQIEEVIARVREVWH